MQDLELGGSWVLLSNYKKDPKMKRSKLLADL